MLTIRRSGERGRTRLGWLESYHTFSFGEYVDAAHMGFGVLRVINDDRIAGGGGFGEHPHRDMEIVTVMLSGALEHGDSLGHRQLLRPGEVQRMTAGRGIRHSEFNASATQPAHLLQIWILPEARGLEPTYEQKDFGTPIDGELTLLVSPDGAAGSMKIRQDARIYRAHVGEGVSVRHRPGERRAWVHAALGTVEVNGQRLSEGDAAAIVDEAEVVITGGPGGGDVLMFDVE